MKDIDLKQHIVEIASSLFYQKGYNLTGIDEIIEEAGITKTAFYDHFASKEDICLAYLQYKNATFRRDIEQYVQSIPPGKPRVYALFEFLKLFFDQKDFNGCWCLNTIAEIPRENVQIKTEVQRQKNDFINFIEVLIQENAYQGSPETNKSIAKQIYLLYEGAVAESKLHQNIWPINACLSICKKILI